MRPGDQRRLLTFLEWKEGDRRLLASSGKDSNDTTGNDKINGIRTP